MTYFPLLLLLLSLNVVAETDITKKFLTKEIGAPKYFSKLKKKYPEITSVKRLKGKRALVTFKIPKNDLVNYSIKDPTKILVQGIDDAEIQDQFELLLRNNNPRRLILDSNRVSIIRGLSQNKSKEDTLKYNTTAINYGKYIKSMGQYWKFEFGGVIFQNIKSEKSIEGKTISPIFPEFSLSHISTIGNIQQSFDYQYNNLIFTEQDKTNFIVRQYGVHRVSYTLYFINFNYFEFRLGPGILNSFQNNYTFGHDLKGDFLYRFPKTKLKVKIHLHSAKLKNDISNMSSNAASFGIDYLF